MAERFSELGMQVLSVDLEAAVAMSGTAFAADLSRPEGNQAAISEALARFGRLDVVVAKHGVVGLVKTLALEGAADGIRSVAICPGYVRTPLLEAQIAAQADVHGIAPERVLEDVILKPHAIKELIEPDEVADLAAFLAGPGGRAFTGVPVTIDQGWTAR